MVTSIIYFPLLILLYFSPNRLNIYNPQIKMLSNPSPFRFHQKQPIFCAIDNHFRFGEQRSRLKHYVLQQLHSQDVHKNQQILLKFRQEADQRKHRSLRLNFDPQPPSTEHRLSIQPNHLPNLGFRQDRFSNYLYDHRYNSIRPTDKTPPPIHRFRTIQQGDSLQARRRKQLQDTYSISKSFLVNKNKHHGQRTQNIMNNKRSLSVDVKQNFKDKALSRIKQIAKKRRKGQQEHNAQTLSTDSSQIIEELEMRRQEFKIKYEHLQKKLKRFKRYKNFIKKRNDDSP